MANWPRAVQPEDRVRYLVLARGEFTNEVKWHKAENTAQSLTATTSRDEYLWAGIEDGVWEAWYTPDVEEPHLVGEFENLKDAQKALIDHVVVIWAVQQAWEDVAG